MMRKPELEIVLALPGVRTAMELADREGRNLYLVGGAVRDLCLKKKVKDIDLILEGRGQNFAHTLAARLKSRVVTLGQSGFQTYRIPLKNAYMDVWDLKNTPLREDLWRRDFTINAVAMHLQSGTWIDPTNGLADLDARILRRVGPGAFREDPLRLLRGIRLKCHYPKFALEPSTLQDMLEAAHLIERVAPERILYEMDLILSSPSLDAGLMLMDETRLLPILLPEIEGIKGIRQYPNNPDDVFQHTMNSLRILPAAVKTFNREFAGKPLLKKEDQLLLAWALLLHDLGKSSTQTEDASGKIHFYDHQRISMKMGGDIARRLRFPRERGDRLQQLIFFHSRPMQLILSDLPDRGVRRFIHQCRHLLPLQLAMFLADRLSRQEILEKAMEFVGTVWARYVKEGDELIHPPRLVSGEEVMEIMALKPSVQVGRILDSLLRLQVAGEISTREQALAYLLRLKAKRAAGRGAGDPRNTDPA